MNIINKDELIPLVVIGNGKKYLHEITQLIKNILWETMWYF